MRIIKIPDAVSLATKEKGLTLEKSIEAANRKRLTILSNRLATDRLITTDT